MVATPRSKKAVFLDRDGVLNIPIFANGRSYAPKTPEDFILYPDALSSCERLAGAGYTLIVVTNQPDIGHGRITRGDIEVMHKRLMFELPITEVYTCPHKQDEGCACRKPAVGLLFQARDDHQITLNESFMVGDRWSDIAAGQNAQVRASVFIDHGYTEQAPTGDFIKVSTLKEAADQILHLSP